MLKLEQMSVTLGKNTPLKRTILNNLNLEVAEGEFVVIIGGNGAGKSTLFNVISGFLPVDFGRIWIAGQDMTLTPQRHRAALVSKVMQDPKVGTMENMTILENMAFAFKRGQMRGLRLFSNAQRIELFKDKLSILNMGLEHRLHTLVRDLSGGQRQALSIVMALLQDSQILLLDEITAALDPASTQSIMELTHRIVRAEKRTCIMITHDMSHALGYGDRLLLLKNGAFIKEYDRIAKSGMTPVDLAAEFGEV